MKKLYKPDNNVQKFREQKPYEGFPENDLRAGYHGIMKIGSGLGNLFGRKPTKNEILAMGAIGALLVCAAFAGCTSTSNSSPSSVVYEKPMDTGVLYEKLGISPNDTLMSYKVHVYPDGAREKVEKNSLSNSGKISTFQHSCDFTFNDNGITNLNCQFDSKNASGYPEYLKARKDSFESSFKQCFANMKKRNTIVALDENKYNPSACIVSSSEPMKCIISGPMADMSSITDDAIEGCRMGVKASNAAYGTNIDVDNFMKYIPIKYMMHF